MLSFHAQVLNYRYPFKTPKDKIWKFLESESSLQEAIFDKL